MGIGKSLEDDETFVFVNEIISLVEGHHKFLANKFVKLGGKCKIECICKHNSSRLACSTIKKSRLY